MKETLENCDCEFKPTIQPGCRCIKADLRVETRYIKWWRWRLKLSAWLTSLACWISKDRRAETWVYYCPHCGLKFSDRKGEPGVSVLTCPYCNYQSLVGGSAERPYLINPDVLQKDARLCGFGCHYEEPHGFLPLTCCPVHGYR